MDLSESELRERLVRIEGKQETQNAQLKEHMARTALLEERQNAFLAALQRIETNVAVWSLLGQGFVKVGLPLIGIATTIGVAIWKTFH